MNNLGANSCLRTNTHSIKCILKCITATALIVILSTACSVKRNGFIGAQDYSYPELPENSVQQTPAYYVPPPSAAEKELKFVTRPRPLPELVDEAPANYGTSKIKNLDASTQVFSLGYNSKYEVSLFITPYEGNQHKEQIQQALVGLGLKQATQLDTTNSVQQYVAQDTSKDTATAINKINIYHYYNSLMISIVQENKKRRTSKKNEVPEEDPTQKFEFMENLRELLIRI